MNATADQIQNIVTLFSEDVRRIIIFVPGGASVDVCAAALGWANVLREQGKDVSVVAPPSLRVSSDDLPGVEEFDHELGAENLIIALPHDPHRVSQVTSHVGEQTGKVFITIKPAAGARPLDADDLEISHGGVSADALVLLGVNDVSEMEPYASEYFELFNTVPSLVVNKNGTPEFGSIRLSSDFGRSLSEESAQLFLQLGWMVNEVAATALLRGVELATNGLSDVSVTAETFDAVAALMRFGAKRIRRAPSTPVLRPTQPRPEVKYSKNHPDSDDSMEESLPIKSLAEILAERQAALRRQTEPMEQSAPRVAPRSTTDSAKRLANQPTDRPNSNSKSKRRRRRRKSAAAATPVTGYAGRKN